MLPTPMKPMAPAQGTARPAKPRMAKPAPPGNALGLQKQAMRAKANVAQRPTMGAPAGQPPGQSVLGGARLLPQHQAGSVRANAARGMAEMQARQQQMQAGQMDDPNVVPEVERQAMANQPPPMMGDRMARPDMGGQMDPMQEMQMRRAKAAMMMQQMQQGGRGIPQNMGDIQSLVPQDMQQQQMQMAQQRMQSDPYAGRFMGQGGPYAGAGQLGARNMAGFDRFGGG
jgi:hypothetical protein